jgi:hypothetical protein
LIKHIQNTIAQQISVVLSTMGSVEPWGSVACSSVITPTHHKTLQDDWRGVRLHKCGRSKVRSLTNGGVAGTGSISNILNSAVASLWVPTCDDHPRPDVSKCTIAYSPRACSCHDSSRSIDGQDHVDRADALVCISVAQ